MPSTYTSNLGIELPADGELDGVWGDVVNDNMNILDRAINGSIVLSLSGTSSTLTTSDGSLSDGQYKLLVLGGSPSGTHTITIAPNDAQKIYFVRNTTAQSVVFTQGSGGNVTVATGDSAIIYSDGAGSGAAVVNITNDFAMSSVKITGGTIDGAVIGGSSAAAGTFTTANATTVDTTNIEVTTLKAKDGTSAGSIADSTGVVTLASSVLTTTDINGGTIDGAVIGGSSAAAGTFTTVTASGDLTIADKIVHSGDTNTSIRFPAADTVTVETSGAERLRVTSAGNVGIGTTAPLGLVDSSSGGYAIIMGANSGVTTRTDATPKLGRFGGYHYTNAAEPVCLILSSAEATNNVVSVGGGTGTMNAATQLRFFTAANSTTVTGTERMRIDSSGNVGIGTSSPSAVLDVRGGSYVIGAAGTRTSDAVAGNGFEVVPAATNNVLSYNRTSNTYLPIRWRAGIQTWEVDNTERMRIDSSGNVGIGTSSPAAGSKLSVYSTSSTDDDDLIALGFATFTPHASIGTHNQDGNSGGIKFSTKGGGTLAERMRIDSSGNVGIGNTSPTTSLQVGSGVATTIDDGAGSQFTPQIQNGQTSGVAGIVAHVNDGTNNRRAGLFVDNTNTLWGLASRYSAGSAMPFVIRNNNAERLRIDGSGNVGIGTTTPGQALSIIRSGATAATFGLRNNTGDASIFMTSQDTGTTEINFGDQTAFNSGLISYVHSSNVLTIKSEATTLFRTGASERMRIDASGNVGIGTTAPIVPLHVTGAAMTTGVIYQNQPAQTSKAAAATLTIAELLTGIIQYTGAADTLTLPTGTSIEGGLPATFPTNMSFDVSVINTGSGTVTIAANGNTTVGGLTVAAGASGMLRVRKTATNTYTVYRIS